MSNKIDYENFLDDNTKNLIMEEFISMYGEERRKEITEKFANVRIVPYDSTMELCKRKVSNLKLKSIKSVDFKTMKQTLSERKNTRKIIHKNAEKVINESHLVMKLSPRDLFKMGNSFYWPILGRINSVMPEPVPFIVLDVGGVPKELVDHVIFHELNHLVESKTKVVHIQQQGLFIFSQDGWCSKGMAIVNGKPVVAGKPNKLGFAEHELFSECINDMLAEQVARNFHSKGYSIISDPATAQYTSRYRQVEFLVKDFYEEYKPDIIKSRAENKYVVMDKINPSLFEQLSSTVDSYAIALRKINKNPILKTMKAKKEALKKNLDSQALTRSQGIMNMMRKGVFLTLRDISPSIATPKKQKKMAKVLEYKMPTGFSNVFLISVLAFAAILIICLLIYFLR